MEVRLGRRSSVARKVFRDSEGRMVVLGIKEWFGGRNRGVLDSLGRN